MTGQNLKSKQNSEGKKMARILIVDDAAIMRRTLQHICEKAGHEVVGMTGDGNEAIMLYKVHKPDLVTMDIMMGESNGITALSVIKKEDPGAKVIMVTAYESEEKKKEVQKLGSVGYLKKPFDAKEVKNEIERVISPASLSNT